MQYDMFADRPDIQSNHCIVEEGKNSIRLLAGQERPPKQKIVHFSANINISA